MANTSNYLDKFSEIIFKEGKNLPHWHQDGKIQYITFRLIDSLPQCKIRELNEAVKQFESMHPKPWTKETLMEYRKIISRSVENIVNKGYGSCILRRGDVRDILSNAILFKDNEDYFVYAFVIMPNHVHLLLQPFPGKELEDIMGSIKKYSATHINKLLNRKGKLWSESYDHIVRDYDEFKHCLNYIIANPQGLPDTDYTLYYT